MLESRRSARCPARTPCIGGYGIRKTLDAYDLARSCYDGNHLSASSVLRLPAQRGDLLAQTAERPYLQLLGISDILALRTVWKADRSSDLHHLHDTVVLRCDEHAQQLDRIFPSRGMRFLLFILGKR